MERRQPGWEGRCPPVVQCQAREMCDGPAARVCLRQRRSPNPSSQCLLVRCSGRAGRPGMPQEGPESHNAGQTAKRKCPGRAVDHRRSPRQSGKGPGPLDERGIQATAPQTPNPWRREVGGGKPTAAGVTGLATARKPDLALSSCPAERPGAAHTRETDPTRRSVGGSTQLLAGKKEGLSKRQYGAVLETLLRPSVGSHKNPMPCPLTRKHTDERGNSVFAAWTFPASSIRAPRINVLRAPFVGSGRVVFCQMGDLRGITLNPSPPTYVRSRGRPSSMAKLLVAMCRPICHKLLMRREDQDMGAAPSPPTEAP